MNEQQIRAMVADALAEIAPEVDVGAVDDSSDLRQALDLDSMDFLNLVIALSQRTGCQIPEADYPKLYNLKNMAAYFAD
ncbi:MAG: acyl carrier protein [Gammaproteobacteria bacterium]|jgi:acyl carrier protein|nr:acyl carrier protein [Gammaproteobacteria bacterium]